MYAIRSYYAIIAPVPARAPREARAAAAGGGTRSDTPVHPPGGEMTTLRQRLTRSLDALSRKGVALGPYDCAVEKDLRAPSYNFV